MKHTWIKLLALVLACLMMATCLVACGKDETPGGGDGKTTTAGGNGGNGGGGDDDEPEITGEELEYLPADANFKTSSGNMEFVIATSTQTAWGLTHHVHVDGVEDVINDALYERELLLQDLFGVVLTPYVDSDQNLYTQLSTNFKSKKSFCNQLMLLGKNSMEAAKSGYLVNLKTLDQLNLEASYYDQRIQQSYQISEMLFQVSGDFDTIDELVTFGILYNDSIYKNLGYYDIYGTPYELVRTYQWTYDMMLTMCQSFTSNDDAKWDDNDKVGLITEAQAAYYFFLGSGIAPINNVNGAISITLLDNAVKEKTTTILQELMTMFNGDHFMIPNRDMEGAPGSEKNKEFFIGDKALFRSSSLSTTLNGMPDMVSDFGILPIPMYESAQQAYYCSLNDNANAPLAIPRYCGDLEDVAQITEIVCYYSKYGGDESLYEAFFNRLTEAKICRKGEDREMLTLIFNSKIFDMDRMVEYVGLLDLAQKAVGAKSQFGGSDLDGALSTAGTKLSQFITVTEYMNQPAA